ncbi:glycosyltransferase family 4 protein [Microbacterium sp. NPDC064584]|uniref:glycosyltransferase family 4 protein n=1 Tax=Microbacterium sp. NPDC064584 TaxID=3155817 RepID=UPI0034343A80
MARIALVTSSYLPRIGGVEEHVAHVARRLTLSGHSVVVWTVDQGDAAVADDGGIPVRYLPCPLPNRSLGGALRFVVRGIGARRAWREAFRRDRPDIVHVHCFGPNGVYATHFAGRSLVVYSHHGETFMDSVFDSSALLRRSLVRSLRRADAVTSCSSYAARDLERFGLAADRVEVVPNGVQLDEVVGNPPPMLHSAGPYVLGVGRLVKVKGFDALIRAYAMLVGSAADGGVDLVIGGDGPDRDRLERLAESLHLSDRVWFPGALSRPEVGAVMSGAVALIVPSRVEAFGITVLEGWRAGIPVIATNNGGPAEFLTDGIDGILVDPGSDVSICTALERVVADPRFASAVGEAGAAAVRSFTWEATAAAYEDLYVRLAQRRK